MCLRPYYMYWKNIINYYIIQLIKLLNFKDLILDDQYKNYYTNI